MYRGKERRVREEEEEDITESSALFAVKEDWISAKQKRNTEETQGCMMSVFIICGRICSLFLCWIYFLCFLLLKWGNVKLTSLISDHAALKDFISIAERKIHFTNITSKLTQLSLVWHGYVSYTHSTEACSFVFIAGFFLADVWQIQVHFKYEEVCSQK